MSQDADIKFFPNQMVEIVGPTNVKISANNLIEVGTIGFRSTTIINGDLQIEKELKSKEKFSCLSDVSVSGSISSGQSVNAYRFRSGDSSTSYLTVNAGSLIIRDSQNKPKLQISSNGDILLLGGDITICGGDLVLEQNSDILLKMPNGEVVSLRSRLNI